MFLWFYMRSRSPRQIPFQAFPSLMLKKAYLIISIFIKPHFTSISNILWDCSGTALPVLQHLSWYLAMYCILQHEGKQASSSSFNFSDQKATNKTASGDSNTNQTPSPRIHFLRKLLWPQRSPYFFLFPNVILLESFSVIVLISNNIFCFPILWALCKIKGQWSKMDFVKATKPL